MAGNTWSEEEIKTLRKNYETLTTEELRELLPNRTEYSILIKGNRIGLQKTADTISRSRPYLCGESSPNWKGGVMYKHGYKYILQKDHPNADRDGYIAEHRVVAEKEIGRVLSHDEIVHHKNGCITDNSPKNLEVLSVAEHTIHHHLGSVRSEITKRRISDAKKKRSPRVEIEVTQL